MANDKYVKLYANFLKNFADLKRPLKVVLDCSNGPAGLVLKNLKIRNLKLIILNSKIDGNFPAHNPNPLEPGALDDAKRAVLREKADLGAVFDADADRAFFVDNLGRAMPFHASTYLLSLESKPPYVGDIYVAKALEHLGLFKVHPSRVGTRNMKLAVKKFRASFGAEFSGHYFFREIKNADSGILATIKALNALSKIPYTSAQFTNLLPDLYYEQFNKKTKNAAGVMKKIVKRYEKKAKKTSRLDGYLFDLNDWFLIVRPSNTEPLLRLFVGSKNKGVLERELKKLKSLA
jgi:phosphomannomutase